MWKKGSRRWGPAFFASTGGVEGLHGFSTDSMEFHFSTMYTKFSTWKAGKLWIKGRSVGQRRVLMLEVMAFTVSAKAVSLFIRCSTCSMACITVVWSRPPNSLPMSA